MGGWERAGGGGGGEKGDGRRGGGSFEKVALNPLCTLGIPSALPLANGRARPVRANVTALGNFSCGHDKAVIVPPHPVQPERLPG